MIPDSNEDGVVRYSYTHMGVQYLIDDQGLVIRNPYAQSIITDMEYVNYDLVTSPSMDLEIGAKEYNPFDDDDDD